MRRFELLYPSYSGLQPARAKKLIRWVYTETNRSFFSIFTIVLFSSIELSFGLALSLVGSIFLGIYASGRRALLLSLLLGLLVDIFFGWPLGVHAAFYVLVCGAILLYTRRFHSMSYWFFILCTLVFSFLYYWIFFHRLAIEHVSLLPVGATFFYWRFYRFKRVGVSY